LFCRIANIAEFSYNKKRMLEFWCFSKCLVLNYCC